LVTYLIVNEQIERATLNESVPIPYGTFDNVVHTNDYTSLEPDLQEHKYFAQGIGLIKSVDLTTGDEEILVEFIPADDNP